MGTAANNRAADQRIRGCHQHVHGIAVLAEAVRHIAVVARVVHGCAHEAIDENRAAIFVHLVLDRIAAQRDLDDHIEVVRHVLPRGHQIERHARSLADFRGSIAAPKIVDGGDFYYSAAAFQGPSGR